MSADAKQIEQIAEVLAGERCRDLHGDTYTAPWCHSCRGWATYAAAAVLAAGWRREQTGPDDVTLPAIETEETVLGIRSELGILEPITQGRKYDTRITPLLTLRRTVFWAESVIDPWEVVTPALLGASTTREADRG